MSKFRIPDDPTELRFISGKHAGKKVGRVLQIDPDYIWDERSKDQRDKRGVALMVALREALVEQCREDDEYDCLQVERDTEREPFTEQEMKDTENDPIVLLLKEWKKARGMS